MCLLHESNMEAIVCSQVVAIQYCLDGLVLQQRTNLLNSFFVFAISFGIICQLRSTLLRAAVCSTSARLWAAVRQGRPRRQVHTTCLASTCCTLWAPNTRMGLKKRRVKWSWLRATPRAWTSPQRPLVFALCVSLASPRVQRDFRRSRPQK